MKKQIYRVHTPPAWRENWGWRRRQIRQSEALPNETREENEQRNGLFMG